MSMLPLKLWWFALTGTLARMREADRTAYGRGWMKGFNAGLKVTVAAQRGDAFMKGFIEGRESVRMEPLDVVVDDEPEESCH